MGLSQKTFRLLEGRVEDIMKIVAGIVPNAIAQMKPGFDPREYRS